MSARISSVTVYCSSSGFLNPAYLALADEAGAAIARSGREVVYGGGRLGMMGRVAASARGAGGRVVGIITDRLRESEQMDPDNHENIVVETMRERKRLLERRGDAILVLPGGVGTLEEFFEVFVGRLVGEHAKPIVLLSPADPDREGGRYYDPLMDMLEHMIDSRFAKPAVRSLLRVCATPGEAIAALDAFESAPPESPDPRTLMPGLDDPERIVPT